MSEHNGGDEDVETLSPKLKTFLKPLKWGGYNANQVNQAFADSMHICLCEVCSATIEIHVKPLGDNPSNDSYTVGYAPFNTGGIVLANGYIWPKGTTPAEATLTLKLDPKQLAALCDRDPQHWLDVYVQDDTMVTWIKLTTTHP